MGTFRLSIAMAVFSLGLASSLASAAEDQGAAKQVPAEVEAKAKGKIEAKHAKWCQKYNKPYPYTCLTCPNAENATTKDVPQKKMAKAEKKMKKKAKKWCKKYDRPNPLSTLKCDGTELACSEPETVSSSSHNQIKVTSPAQESSSGSSSVENSRTNSVSAL